MARIPVIKDIHVERAMFSSRLLFLVLLVGVSTAILLTRIYKLQVLDYNHYSTLAKENRIRIRPVAPARGIIYDRNGKVLADNHTAFNLEITPYRTRDLGNTLLRLRKLLGVSEDQIQRFQKLRRTTPPFRPVPLLYNLSDEQVARFSMERAEFPGVEIKTRLRRYYPQGERMAHVLGYVGRINDRDLKTLDSRAYRGATHIGKSGIEKFYEASLHGAPGTRQEEINSRGRYIRTLSESPPVRGEGLLLTLDTRLQQVAYEALAKYKSGAIVAMDPRNGEVLAAVSLPAFDPNLFVNGISGRDYGRLRDDPDRPLFNRLTSGQYPPGSTIKPLTALAGLAAGVVTADQRMFAGPYYTLPNSPRKYRDWKRGGHGWVDLDKAITQSCDVYFYDLSYRLGIDRLHAMFAQFGLGRPTGIDLVGEKKGLNPSRQWKRKTRHQDWFPGETVIVGIGQGYLLATPLQLAEMTACLAERGRCVTPTLLKSRFARDERLTTAQAQRVHQIEGVSAEQWHTVIASMRHVIEAPNGTGRRAFKGVRYSAAGKTGTAQVFGLDEGEDYDADELSRRLRDHSLFIGFAPVESPRIAVAVVVEHGGHGSRAAAPVARQVMDAWLHDGAGANKEVP